MVKIVKLILEVFGFEYTRETVIEWDKEYKCYRPAYYQKIRRIK